MTASHPVRPENVVTTHAGTPGNEPCLLAIDQGTTSSRTIVFDTRGRILAVGQIAFAQHYPQPGWVEHNPQDIWESQQQSMHAAIKSAGLKSGQIRAIGIANQRETFLVWERASGKPLTPAIVWQDRRSSALCARLRAQGHENEVQRRTGLLIDPYFSGTKLAWLLEQDPALRRRGEAGELCFGTIDSWLVWKLCGPGTHLIDLTNASRTLLMDLRRGQWDDHMLELLRIPPRMLPSIVPSTLAAHELPITELGVPLTGIAGDQQAALFGQAASRAGMAKNTYGTGCFMLMQLGAKPRQSGHRLLTTSACSANPKAPSYALEGSVFVAGAAVQWLRDELGLLEHSAQSAALAASVPDTADCFLVPAFTGLGAPHWDAQARGALIGITRGTRRAHLVRAALESIAYQSAEVLAAMHADAAQPLTELRVDGGASANDWLMQFQADMLGVPVNRPSVLESTALGAAQLAGLGCGLFSSTDDCESMREVDRIFEPQMSRDEAAQRMARWVQAVERARGWAPD